MRVIPTLHACICCLTRDLYSELLHTRESFPRYMRVSVSLHVICTVPQALIRTTLPLSSLVSLSSLILLSPQAIPLTRQRPLLQLVVGRLRDKSSTVRKYALQLLTAFLTGNPFAGKVSDSFSGYIKLAYCSSVKGAPVAQLVRASD